MLPGMQNARIKGQQIPLDICRRDGYALVAQGLATMVRVAQSDDMKHALAASQWLVQYGENIMAEQRARKTGPLPQLNGQGNRNDRAQLLAELRGLYAKALGEAPLIVEAAAELVDEPAVPPLQDADQPAAD